MANAPYPPLEPRTPLWSLGFKLHSVAGNFKGIFNDIRDVWLLGTWLAWPFFFMYTYFMSAGDFCIQADDKLVDVITWVKGITEGSTFWHLLSNVTYDIGFILRDPVGWLLWRLDTISYIYRQLRDDPYGWFRDKLLAVFPIFYDIIYNTYWWFRDRIRDLSGDLVWLLDDSWGFIYHKVIGVFGWAWSLQFRASDSIIDWITERVWWFRSFLNQPRQTIIDFIRQQSWDIDELITDPRKWVNQRVFELLGIDYYSYENVITQITKKLISELVYMSTPLIETLFSQFVDFVVRFL